MLRIFACAILALALTAPASAADTAATTSDKSVKADDSAKSADKAKNDAAKTTDAKQSAKEAKADAKSADSGDGKDAKDQEEEKTDPNVLKCQYYTVTLPQGWTAVTPPTEDQGRVTSVFKSTNGGIAIMLVLGQLGGADTKTIADMFAEQFKAEKPPVEKNGQYTFSFTRDNELCDAYVTSHDDIFMMTTITGNRKEALAFIKNQVKSEDYAKLLPR